MLNQAEFQPNIYKYQFYNLFTFGALENNGGGSALAQNGGKLDPCAKHGGRMLDNGQPQTGSDRKSVV